jgi:tetratricopeptide (TPR) repeat protein
MDDELRALQLEAEALLERRRYAQARQAVARGLARAPDDLQFQYLGAFVDHAQGELDAAIRSVQAILARHPGHYGARTLAAHVHEARREYREAESMLLALLRDYPEEASLYADYAEVMLSTLHLDKALELAREGLRHEPDHPGCLQVVAVAELIEGRSGADSEHLGRLLRLHPERLNTLTTLVLALDDRGDHRAALRLAQELLRSQPDEPQLVEMVRGLKGQNHWSMLPLYPMQRWGWGGAIGVTIAGMAGLRFLDGRLPDNLQSTVSLLWFAYVVYSWVWPSILRRLV